MPKLDDLVGLILTRVEHITGESDADEAVRLTFNDGQHVLRIGTSEWLHIELDGELIGEPIN